MASALFDINGDGGDQGFAATNSQVLTLRLRQRPPLGVSTVLFQVFDPAGFNPDLGIAGNPPRASLDAPPLTIVCALNSTSGPSLSPATVDGSVTITLPAVGYHSWIVRCLVNGGLRTLPNGQQVIDPTLIHERGVYIPTTFGARKVVCTELRQFSDGGWADALDFLVEPSSFLSPVVVSPVFVESYLAANGFDIRSALRAALLANLAPGTVFVTPPGPRPWVGSYIQLADGLRNNITLSMYGTDIIADEGGVAGGQKILFARLETDATHADRIKFLGGKMSHLNVLTSFFSSAIYFTNASNCECIGTEFFCSLDGAATLQRARWGIAFFGGTPTNGGGRNNVVRDLRTTRSQIVLCSQGYDVDGIVCENIVSEASNDYVVSCVSSDGASMRNVRIDGIICHNITGSGVVFGGSDGGSVGGTDVIENFTIQNIECDGAKVDTNLNSNAAGLVVFDGGKVNRNIRVQGIDTTLVQTTTGTGARSVIIQSDPAEVSWQGLVVADMNLGVITTLDPLEALYISGLNIQQVAISNINVRGLRGIHIYDCDHMTISNVTTLDGSMIIEAFSRNLATITISNSALKRATGFNSALSFQSATGKSMSIVALDNLILDCNSAGLITGLAGGAMSMLLNNVWNVSGSNLGAETLAGILRSVNTPGIVVVTTVSVAVPAVAAGAVDYAIVDMTGTRLADLVVGEPVCAVPSARLAAPGAGGAYCNARVSSPGHIELAFIGPLGSGSMPFNFARAAA